MISKISQVIEKERSQFLVFFWISLAVLVLAGLVSLIDHSIFKKYLGSLHPLITFLFVIALAGSCFFYLLQHSGTKIFRSGSHPGLFLSFIAALLLAVLIILLVDRRGGYGRDINVAFPQSVLFYPAIGYVVETVFHILPFTILYFLASAALGSAQLDRSIWLVILIVSLIEPLYQALISPQPDWVRNYQLIHIFIINIIQLVLFVRYDFVSMFSFRLVYYLLWHIIWGVLRLRFLF